MDDVIELESMQDMVRRLAGSGSGAQAKAVLKGIEAINSASGMLDEQNRATALVHLAVALSGKDHAATTLEAAAFLASETL